MADRDKNPTLGKASPIKIVNLIYSGGDARGGVMTAAFNLPNDEKVLAQHGSKKVMLKNVQKAKFEQILTPLAKLAVPKKSWAVWTLKPSLLTFWRMNSRTALDLMTS
jgi:hypothetical protein